MEFNMKNKIVFSCELLEIFDFFESLNLDYHLYLDLEGLTFYVSQDNILIDLIILDNKYFYYCKIKDKEYSVDGIDILKLKDDIIFKSF